MSFVRLRRLRRSRQIRDLVAETRLSVGDLVLPYFVTDGAGRKEAVELMPGVCRLSQDSLVEDVKEAEALGIRAVLLFGGCRQKDEEGTEAYSGKGVLQGAIRALRRKVRDVIVLTDVCLCAYTPHGHCGIIKKQGAEAGVDNDGTARLLGKIALSHARAGADFVAPSAMADGQVKMIREALDKNGFEGTGILAYSAKYASNFYGPFRHAQNSAPRFGDRKSYQLDFRNSDEALREIREDISEGADMVMVKPALAYLDVICRAKQSFNVPIVAYNVSGEYSLVKAAAQRGVFDERGVTLEILTSIKRAGADLIVSYGAKEVARWLEE